MVLFCYLIHSLQLIHCIEGSSNPVHVRMMKGGGGGEEEEDGGHGTDMGTCMRKVVVEKSN